MRYAAAILLVMIAMAMVSCSAPEPEVDQNEVVVNSLLEQLNDPDPQLRAEAAKELWFHTGPPTKNPERIIEALTEALDDESEDVGVYVIRTLGNCATIGRLESPRMYLPKLLEIVKTGPAKLRIEVFRSLVDFIDIELPTEKSLYNFFKNREAIDDFLEKNKTEIDQITQLDEFVDALIVAGQLSDENEREVARTAIIYLGPLMISGRDKLTAIATGQDVSLRKWAVDTIYRTGKIPDELLPIVKSFIAQRGNEFGLGLAVIKRDVIPDDETTDLLIGHLGDENPYVRMDVIEILGKLARSTEDEEMIGRIMDVLQVALQDDDADVRGKAIVVLGALEEDAELVEEPVLEPA